MTGYDPQDSHRYPDGARRFPARPAKLQGAYAAYEADPGEKTRAALEALQVEAVQDSIAQFEATGSPFISDGEQRISSFATYPRTDTLAGTGLADNLGGSGTESRAPGWQRRSSASADLTGAGVGGTSPRSCVARTTRATVNLCRGPCVAGAGFAGR